MMRALRRSACGGTRDAGMTLVELLFAMVIIAIVAAGSFAGLAAAMRTTNGDRNHVAAANLAARELEISRNEFQSSATALTTFAAGTLVTNPHPLPGQTVGNPLVVDNVAYTVVRTVEWLPAGAGKSPCDGGSLATFPSLAVQVDISWPQMYGSPHVINNTLLTPSKTILNGGTLAFAAVKVVNYLAVASEGQVVTLTGPGGTFPAVTADDGCAVFSTTVPGAYTASLNTSGYVDGYLVANPNKPVTMTVGQLYRPAPFNYDKAVTLKVTATTQGGYNLPTTLPYVTLANVGLTTPSATVQYPSTGTTTSVGGLWPFASPGYSVWSGSCNQNDPAASGGSRPSGVTTTPGGTSNVTVTLAPVSVTATRLALPVVGAVVTAKPVLATGCLGTEASATGLTLGVTDSSGNLKTSLPAGAWTVKVTSGTSASVVTPTLLPTSGLTSLAVVLP